MALLRKMWKDSGSGDGGCHAIYDTDGDYYVLQGDPASIEEIAQGTEIGDGELFIRVKRNVIDRVGQ